MEAKVNRLGAIMHKIKQLPIPDEFKSIIDNSVRCVEKFRVNPRCN
jgi:hypothetical protein